MDKQQSVADETASFKEYPPSEIYTTSDPPPAYMKRRESGVVQVARITAYALVAVSFILGCFILASSYVSATLSCQQYQPYPQEYVEDRLPRFQGLVADPLESEETKHHQVHSTHQQEQSADDKQAEQSVTEEQPAQQPQQPEQSELKFKFPIHLDLDALTGAILEGDSKSKMNCVVEKQKSEEVLNKDQRELITFGLDLTSLDPGLKHVTGERLAIVCETSREAPKETGPSPGMLPFPLGGLQRMPPQVAMQRMPFHLPFFRPHPFQNFMARNQPQTVPRRNVEEIPVLVLEDETRLQNLLHMPRAAHPPMQNLEFHRVNPQIQGLVELARAAEPALHNLIDLPESKPFHMMHPASPEARHLPPWARPELQEQVVQIRAVPSMVRPPQGPAPVHVEARPFHMESAAIQVQGGPMQVEARPIMDVRPLESRMPEGRALPIPSDTVNPPPPPFDMRPEPSRPHFVQPRSVRSVDDGLHRRVKRLGQDCACQCAC